MAIFRKRIVLESRLPADEVRKKLFTVVKTPAAVCARCGQILTGGGAALFCSNCGQPVSRPIPLQQPSLARYFAAPSARRGYQFEGSVSPQTFRITRIISYRNPCVPLLEGRFEPMAEGTRILIELKMQVLGYLFLIGTTGFSFLVLCVLSFGGDKPLQSAGLAVLPFAAPCFFFLVSWLCFAFEAGLARAAMSRILGSVPPISTTSIAT